jgi:hypothetical protein
VSVIDDAEFTPTAAQHDHHDHHDSISAMKMSASSKRITPSSKSKSVLGGGAVRVLVKEKENTVVTPQQHQQQHRGGSGSTSSTTPTFMKPTEAYKNSVEQQNLSSPKAHRSLTKKVSY